MTVLEAIEARRAYRCFEPGVLDIEAARAMADAARLAPSCFNNQPWRFLFVLSTEKLTEMKAVFSKGNEWAHNACAVIAVFSKKELDCIVKTRDYWLYDTGMAAGFLILRATELGFVAHPIAGYNESMAHDILGIPPEMQIITLIVIGKKRNGECDYLSDKQKESESMRPERLPRDATIFIDRYTPPISASDQPS